MTTILLVDRDRATCSEIRSILAERHNVVAVHTALAAFKSLTRRKADMVIVKTSSRDQDAVALLEGLKERGIGLPVIVVLGARASSVVAKLRRLGASVILRWPARRRRSRLAEAVALAGSTPVAVRLTVSATKAPRSLEQLRRRLNRDIKCSVGKNAVLIRPSTNGNGGAANPRIALECPLRAEFGLVPHVFYEYIRDRCCDDPTSCPAVHIFQRKQRDDNQSPPRAQVATPGRQVRNVNPASVVSEGVRHA